MEKLDEETLQLLRETVEICREIESRPGYHYSRKITTAIDLLLEWHDRAELDRAAVSAVLERIRTDGRVAYLLGWGTQTYYLLTEAEAASRGVAAEKWRREFWDDCALERVRVVDREKRP